MTNDYMLLECAMIQEIRYEYYIFDSMRTLFKTIPDIFILNVNVKLDFFIWYEHMFHTIPYLN